MFLKNLCYSYWVNELIELIVIDEKLFISQKKNSDKRICDYMLSNHYYKTYLAYKMDLYNEIEGDFLYYPALMVNILFSYINSKH